MSSVFLPSQMMFSHVSLTLQISKPFLHFCSRRSTFDFYLQKMKIKKGGAGGGGGEMGRGGGAGRGRRKRGRRSSSRQSVSSCISASPYATCLLRLQVNFLHFSKDTFSMCAVFPSTVTSSNICLPLSLLHYQYSTLWNILNISHEHTNVFFPHL